MRVADFFCGGGGFSEGFRQAGFEIVFAVDKWEPAVRTYKGNKPGVNVIKDDIIRISQLPDEEFEKLVPDSEVIIGSPPCQSFSHSNKSGNGDKTIGIQLIEAYLRIIARKKYKKKSVLKYWVLENVPAVKNYIQEEYSASDLGLKGNFILRPHGGASGKYNAKYYGAPTNRERYLCGEFPQPVPTKDDSNLVTLKQVLDSLGNPLRRDGRVVKDINYPGLSMNNRDITDQHYIYELAEFEWKTAKRLKQDKGYMGKMSFPENLSKPARTVMATMTTSARESMIIEYGRGRYRLPTVREAACMMSFPIDYQFYGESKGVKHTLVGNAVPPKLSYAIAVAIAQAGKETLPARYIPIRHNQNYDRDHFRDLNGAQFEIKRERPKRESSKFKYHIPYLIIDAYRVELTNYQSDFEKKDYLWAAEIHYSQGKKRAKKYAPNITMWAIPRKYKEAVREYIRNTKMKVPNRNLFQSVFCMTTGERTQQKYLGPFELLESVKTFIDSTFSPEEQREYVHFGDFPNNIPLAIAVGYLVLKRIVA